MLKGTSVIFLYPSTLISLLYISQNRLLFLHKCLFSIIPCVINAHCIVNNSGSKIDCHCWKSIMHVT